MVLFNGEGQSCEQQYQGSYLRGSLHYLMDNGKMKYVLANGTGPMSDKFSRNFRHFLWMDKVIYMIDDIAAHKPGHFEWLWHYNGKAVKRRRDGDLRQCFRGHPSVVSPSAGLIRFRT